MRRRIADVRACLAGTDEAAIDLSFVGRQKGLFALLPLDPNAVETLRRDHSVYMARTGRINLAGLNDRTMPRFIAALNSVFAAKNRRDHSTAGLLPTAQRA